jgi:SAM-dependent methyltransferase
MSNPESKPSTTDASFFEAKYRAQADPWNFAGSAYEQSRYDAILGALDKPRYTRAFEPACSVGELTQRLATRCDNVEASDISPSAVDRAKERCRNFSNVHIAVGTLPHHIPNSQFDLIVFSEVGYYFDEAGLRSLIAMLVDRLSNGSTFLAAHWLGSSKDHLLSGDQVHQILADTIPLQLGFSSRTTDYRLDRWTRA